MEFVVCVCVGREVFCYNQIYFGSIVLCLQYFHTLGGYFLCVGRQVFCSIQDDTCIVIKHIYIYIYIESMVILKYWWSIGILDLLQACVSYCWILSGLYSIFNIKKKNNE